MKGTDHERVLGVVVEGGKGADGAKFVYDFANHILVIFEVKEAEEKSSTHQDHDHQEFEVVHSVVLKSVLLEVFSLVMENDFLLVFESVFPELLVDRDVLVEVPLAQAQGEIFASHNGSLDVGCIDVDKKRDYFEGKVHDADGVEGKG